MKVQFCGAARQVTGSSHLITLDSGFTILLDCGLYQGYDKTMEGFNETWIYDPKKIDCLIVSHAHIDHTGRIPKLVGDGYEGRIYATNATRSLASIMLMDSAGIQERDAEYHNKRSKDKIKPLYTKDDARKAIGMFTGMGYGQWFKINDEVELQFRDAGHILGSASVTLRIKEEGKEAVTFGFTGDIGRPERPILRNPVPMPECDYLICESTYGAKDHMGRPDEVDRLLDIIKEVCIHERGKLLIPAFSVGRTQEIVYMLDRLETNNMLPKIKVYVDSPLAVDATDIFAMHPECFDGDLHDYMMTDPNPFGFKNLTYIRKVEYSKRLNDMKDPCIIISASGMMNAGRVKHHLYNTMGDPKNAVLIVGYCAPGTPGGQLRAGKETLKLFGEECAMKAQVYTMDSFSAHGDRTEMMEFIKNQQNLKNLFLVHGTYDRQEEFKTFLEGFGFSNIEIPDLGQEYDLG